MNGVNNPKEFLDDLLPEMQRSKKFEKLAVDLTVNRMAGAGSLTKYRQRL